MIDLHCHLLPGVDDGVGFVIEYSITLTKSEPGGGASGVISTILSIFDLN